MNNLDLQNALNTYLFSILDNRDDIYLVPIFADTDPPKEKIFCTFNLAFGDVAQGELGYNGNSPRTSVYTVAFSVDNTTKVDEMLALTDEIEQKFRRKEIATGIICGDPYTTNAGLVDNDERYSYYVSIPISTWTYNK